MIYQDLLTYLDLDCNITHAPMSGVLTRRVTMTNSLEQEMTNSLLPRSCQHSEYAVANTTHRLISSVRLLRVMMHCLDRGRKPS